MIRVKACFVAEGVIIDRDTNQISAFGLLDNLQSDTYPKSVQKLAFFCLWTRTSGDPERVTCKFSVTQNQRDIARQDIDIDFQGHLYNRCNIRLERFALNEPGTVVFRLAIPGHDTAEWTMEASHTAAAEPGAVGPTGSSRIYDSGNVSISVGGANVHAR